MKHSNTLEETKVWEEESSKQSSLGGLLIFVVIKVSCVNSFTMDDIVVVETKIKKGILSSESSSSESVNGDRSDNDLLFAGSQDFNCQVDLGSDITKCCVPNCATSSISNINSSQISFVTFPKDPSR